MYPLEQQAALQHIPQNERARETLQKASQNKQGFKLGKFSSEFHNFHTPKEWKAGTKFAWQSDIVTDWELPGLDNQDHATRQQGLAAGASIL